MAVPGLWRVERVRNAEGAAFPQFCPDVPEIRAHHGLESPVSEQKCPVPDKQRHVRCGPDDQPGGGSEPVRFRDRGRKAKFRVQLWRHGGRRDKIRRPHRGRGRRGWHRRRIGFAKADVTAAGAVLLTGCGFRADGRCRRIHHPHDHRCRKHRKQSKEHSEESTHGRADRSGHSRSDG